MMALAILITGIQPVKAIDLENLFGHTVRIEGEYPELALKVDDRELHRNAILLFEELVIVDGVPTLIGSSSNGGNACDGTPFVVSFPPGRKPRFDGPIEACANIEREVSVDKVVFSTKNIPGKGREQWSWTPTDGLKELGVVAFTPEDKSGWQALRERAFQHPSDALQNAEIVASLNSLLGADFDAFQEIITGMGGGEFKSGDYVGTTCTPHMCREQEALLFLSAKNRRAYAAWKPYEKKIVVHPPIKEWPENAKQELRAWAEKWK
jgi:hypothetical protein